jgi:opacity protein-like surface antigen
MWSRIVDARICGIVLTSFAALAVASGQSSQLPLPATAVSLSAGVLRYDFNKVGTTPLAALAVSHQFGTHLVIMADGEVATGFKARPDNAAWDYDGTYSATMLSAQWQFPTGRLQPYVGLGLGYYNLGMSTDRLVTVDLGCATGADCGQPAFFDKDRSHQYGAIGAVMFGSRMSLTSGALVDASVRLGRSDACNSGTEVCPAEFRLGLGYRF